MSVVDRGESAAVALHRDAALPVHGPAGDRMAVRIDRAYDDAVGVGCAAGPGGAAA